MLYHYACTSTFFKEELLYFQWKGRFVHMGMQDGSYSKGGTSMGHSAILGLSLEPSFGTRWMLNRNSLTVLRFLLIQKLRFRRRGRSFLWYWMLRILAVRMVCCTGRILQAAGWSCVCDGISLWVIMHCMIYLHLWSLWVKLFCNEKWPNWQFSRSTMRGGYTIT